MGQDADNSVLLFVGTPNAEGEFNCSPGAIGRAYAASLSTEGLQAELERNNYDVATIEDGGEEDALREKVAKDFASVLEDHERRDEVLLLVPAGDDLSAGAETVMFGNNLVAQVHYVARGEVLGLGREYGSEDGLRPPFYLEVVDEGTPQIAPCHVLIEVAIDGSVRIWNQADDASHFVQVEDQVLPYKEFLDDLQPDCMLKLRFGCDDTAYTCFVVTRGTRADCEFDLGVRACARAESWALSLDELRMKLGEEGLEDDVEAIAQRSGDGELTPAEELTELRSMYRDVLAPRYAELAARPKAREIVESCTYKELQGQLKSRGLRAAGKTAELKARLEGALVAELTAEALAPPPPEWRARLHSTGQVLEDEAPPTVPDAPVRTSGTGPRSAFRRRAFREPSLLEKTSALANGYEEDPFGGCDHYDSRWERALAASRADDKLALIVGGGGANGR